MSKTAERAAGLSAVPSTLLIPLAGRAFGDAVFPELAVGDADAARVLAALGDDGALWQRDRASVYGVLARTRRFRDLAARFVAAHPAGHVVNLGCGLSNYRQWLDNGRMHMTDADLPEVLAIRRRLLPARGRRHRLCAVDLNAADWWADLGLPSAQDRHDARAGRAGHAAAPLFLFAEGVLMYLAPARARAVLRTFGQRAPAGSTFAFDAMCWLVVGHAGLHPSVRHTDAEFRWGPRTLDELCADSPRLQLAAAHPIMQGYGWPYQLMEPAFQALLGVPLYAVYELRTGDALGRGRRA
ncbi:MAG: class I SAM-dependent methyltransferase [Proteobacteria bacterium]|nr:class I SAM-dependent methyltransferase [Pseudomonadota bacterium]